MVSRQVLLDLEDWLRTEMAFYLNQPPSMRRDATLAEIVDKLRETKLALQRLDESL